MNVKECYDAFGGDYADTVARLGKESLIIKLLKRFQQDNSLENLSDALTVSDVQAAFSCAHTLKGVALNLGFTALAESSSALTEKLRGGSMDGADELLSAVKRDYLLVRDAINRAEL